MQAVQFKAVPATPFKLIIIFLIIRHFTPWAWSVALLKIIILILKKILIILQYIKHLNLREKAKLIINKYYLGSKLHMFNYIEISFMGLLQKINFYFENFKFDTIFAAIKSTLYLFFYIFYIFLIIFYLIALIRGSLLSRRTTWKALILLQI